MLLLPVIIINAALAIPTSLANHGSAGNGDSVNESILAASTATAQDGNFASSQDSSNSDIGAAVSGGQDSGYTGVSGNHSDSALGYSDPESSLGSPIPAAAFADFESNTGENGTMKFSSTDQANLRYALTKFLEQLMRKQGWISIPDSIQASSFNSEYPKENTANDEYSQNEDLDGKSESKLADDPLYKGKADEEGFVVVEETPNHGGVKTNGWVDIPDSH